MPSTSDQATLIVTTVLVLIAFVPVLAGGAVLWWWLARRRKSAARIAAMSPAELELSAATAEYDNRVRVADSAHRAAYDAYQAGIVQAERNLAAANLIGTRELGRYMGRDSGLLLFEDRIAWAPSGGNWTYHPLDDTVRATVDATGSVYSSERSTLTRMAAGGAVMGKAGVVAGAAARKTTVNDVRELYLMVEGAQFSVVVTCNPDHGAAIRQLSAQITNAGRQASALQEQRPVAVAQAQLALDGAKAATGHASAAHAAVEAARADTVRMVAARRAVELEAAHSVIEAPKPDDPVS